MKGLAGKSAILLVSRLAARGVQVVSFILLARILSPAGFGAFGVLTAAVVLSGQIGNLGLRQAAAYQVGRGDITPGTAFGLLIGFWPLAAVCCAWAVTAFNAEALGILDAAHSQFLIFPLVAATAAYLLLVLLQGIFLGKGDIRAFALTDNGPRILQAAMVALLWVMGMLSVGSALWSYALAFALLVPVAIYLAREGADPIALPVAHFVPMIRYGLLFAVSMFLINLQTRAGLFLVSGAEGNETAGNFLAAQRLNEIFLEIATAIGLVIFSESTKAVDPKQAVHSAAKASSAMIWMFLAIALGIWLTAQYLIPLLLGAQYAGAVGAARVLAFSLVPSSVIKLMNGAIAGSGRPYF
ncbi:oligosaccharide flippase family protein, partial [Sphingomonas sp. MJ1 (PH-R8)]|uniref:oligosaccharide flippase family protein n=1 Tax=Sphingomonas sp. MJ1 (PH-R8) TaxID=3112950 RepID=UPI003A83AADD